MKQKTQNRGSICRKHRNNKGQYTKNHDNNIHKHGKNTTTTKTLKVRKYRKDKTKPKKTQITITEDLGKYEQITSLTSNYTVKQTVMTKNPNPNLLSILKEPIRMIWYIDSEKGFVYNENKEYLGKIEKWHLKHLFSKIGHLLRSYKIEPPNSNKNKPKTTFKQEKKQM